MPDWSAVKKKKRKERKRKASELTGVLFLFPVQQRSEIAYGDHRGSRIIVLLEYTSPGRKHWPLARCVSEAEMKQEQKNDCHNGLDLN